MKLVERVLTGGRRPRADTDYVAHRFVLRVPGTTEWSDDNIGTSKIE